MSNITVKSNGRPTAAQVREFGRAQTPPLAGSEKGTRGRLAPALIVAFNEGKVGSHRYDDKKRAVVGTKVTVKPEKGRSKTVTYDAKAARAALAEAGVTVKATGRLPKAALASLILNG